MLQHFPHSLGQLLRPVRPGSEKLVYHDFTFNRVPEILEVTSPAFGDGEDIPIDYSFDGMRISPPLKWHGVPANARSMVLIMEDADSPTPEPLTHAIITGLPAMNDQIPEGAFRNFGARYLPPDPPPGHGPHHYAFQLFALDNFLHPIGIPSKETVKAAMRNHVVARGCLTGIYERR